MLLYDRIADAYVVIDHALKAEMRSDVCPDTFAIKCYYLR